MGRKRTKQEKTPKYQFNIGEIAIYVHGLYPEYKNQECKILSRSRPKGTEWYRIIFQNEFDILTTGNTLKKKEDQN
jgi:hypothetical protein